MSRDWTDDLQIDWTEVLTEVFPSVWRSPNWAIPALDDFWRVIDGYQHLSIPARNEAMNTAYMSFLPVRKTAESGKGGLDEGNTGRLKNMNKKSPPLSR